MNLANEENDGSLAFTWSAGKVDHQLYPDRTTMFVDGRRALAASSIPDEEGI